MVFERSRAPWGTLFRNRQGKVNGRGTPAPRAGGGLSGLCPKDVARALTTATYPPALGARVLFNQVTHFSISEKSSPWRPLLPRIVFKKLKYYSERCCLPRNPFPSLRDRKKSEHLSGVQTQKPGLLTRILTRHDRKRRPHHSGPGIDGRV